MKYAILIILLLATVAVAEEPQDDRDRTVTVILSDRDGEPTNWYVPNVPVEQLDEYWVIEVWNWFHRVLAWYEVDS